MPDDQLHSIVVFTGDAGFKSPISVNVFQDDGFISFIKSKQLKNYKDIQIETYLTKLQVGCLEDSAETDKMHVDNVGGGHEDEVRSENSSGILDFIVVLIIPAVPFVGTGVGRLELPVFIMDEVLSMERERVRLKP